MKTTTMDGRARFARTALVALALLAGPLPAAAQLQSCQGRLAGGLGITGLSCRDCAFTTDEGAMVRARFGTEPEVLAVTPESALRVGDVLVAIDDRLITTRQGAARLTSLGPDETTRLRVRRDGRTETLTVRTTAICRSDEPAPDAPAPPVVPSPRGAVVAPAPPSATSVAPALPPLAPPPSLSEMRPDARLGFSFECSECHYDGSDGLWRFAEAPVVFRVEPDGPADGLLEPGDVLLAVNSQDLTEPDGSLAFSLLRPEREVVWTVRRDGRTREVTTRTEPKFRATTVQTPAAPRAPGSASGISVVSPTVSDVLRYAGTLGEARVEVRGQPITVTLDEDGSVLVIRTPGNEIRIEVPRSAGGG